MESCGGAGGCGITGSSLRERLPRGSNALSDSLHAVLAQGPHTVRLGDRLERRTILPGEKSLAERFVHDEQLEDSAPPLVTGAPAALAPSPETDCLHALGGGPQREQFHLGEVTLLFAVGAYATDESLRQDTLERVHDEIVWHADVHESVHCRHCVDGM